MYAHAKLHKIYTVAHKGSSTYDNINTLIQNISKFSYQFHIVSKNNNNNQIKIMKSYHGICFLVFFWSVFTSKRSYL